MIGLAAICIAAPVFFSDLFAEGWIVPKLFICAIGAIILWITLALEAGVLFTVPSHKTGTARALIYLWVAVALATYFSIDRPTSFLGLYAGQFHGVLEIALYTLIYVAASRCYAITGDRVIGAVLLGCVIPNGLAIWQKLGPLFGCRPWLLHTLQGGRAGGTFGSPIFLGGFVALVMPLAYYWHRRGGLHAVLGFLAFLIALGAGLASVSRGALVGGIIACIAYETMRGDIKSALKTLATAGAMVITYAAIGNIYHSGADLGRLEIWKTAIIGWLHNPIFGSGPDTFSLLYRRYVPLKIVELYRASFYIQMSAHSDILQVLSTMGLVGLAAYAYFAWSVVRGAWDRRYSGPGIAVIAGLLSVFIFAKFDPVHLVVICICAALAGAENRVFIPTPATTPEWAVQWRGAVAVALCGVFVGYGVFRTTQAEARAAIYEQAGRQMWNEQPSLRALEMYNKAAVESPWHMHYIQGELTKLYQLSAGVNMNDVASIWIMTMDYQTKMHPHDSVAHDMRSLALKLVHLAYRADTLKQSQAEMVQAAEYWPTFADYQRDAAEIAREANDESDFVRRKRRYQEIEAMGGRS